MKHFLLSMMIVCGLFSSAMAGVIQETIEAAVKISGKSMSRASRQAAVASLKKLASKLIHSSSKVAILVGSGFAMS